MRVKTCCTDLWKGLCCAFVMNWTWSAWIVPNTFLVFVLTVHVISVSGWTSMMQDFRDIELTQYLILCILCLVLESGETVGTVDQLTLHIMMQLKAAQTGLCMFSDRAM